MYDGDILDEIRKRKEEWERKIQDEQGRVKERKESFTTLGEIPVKRVYTPLDVVDRDIDYLRDISFPGEYPFTWVSETPGKAMRG